MDGKNSRTFTITVASMCKTDGLTLAVTPNDPAILLYSGTTKILTAATFTHSINSSPCNTYHTQIVEVSDDGGTNWHSSGTVYTDLLASENTVFALEFKPKASVFDSGTTDRTRKVRISVYNPYS